MDAGVFFIISGEIGLHTKKGGVFGKAISENTLGEECIQDNKLKIPTTKNVNYLETAFCLSESCTAIFINAESIPRLKLSANENDCSKDFINLENSLRRNFILKRSIRNFALKSTKVTSKALPFDV